MATTDGGVVRKNDPPATFRFLQFEIFGLRRLLR